MIHKSKKKEVVPNDNGIVKLVFKDAIGNACKELVALQRQRAVIIKSHIMQANRLCAVVAHDDFGYVTDMSESERKKIFKKAKELVKNFGQPGITSKLGEVIRATKMGLVELTRVRKSVEKEMLVYIKQLPIVNWILDPDQHGVDLKYIGVIIGETNDLRLYSKWTKVWRRFGLAPWSYMGHSFAGSTWRSGKTVPKKDHERITKKPALTSEEWINFGYCPRRRSVAYLIGRNLIMQNYTGKKRIPGPYRLEYDRAYAKMAKEQPGWEKRRYQRHGMLMATKMFLKKLWQEWHRLA